MKPHKLVRAPDGGWGWMVVIGGALTNMVNQSLVSVFGLIFGPQLEEMGHGTVGIGLVMNIASMVTNFSGLIVGPILKKYSSKTVSIIGTLFSAFGMILSSRATNIIHVIIGYGIFTGLGFGLIMPSTFVAINSYFTKRRSQAVGLSMAGTGIGQMLMPQVVRYLMDEYGYRGTALILGALSLNGLTGAMLFHPVEWHMKTFDNNQNMEKSNLLKREEETLDEVCSSTETLMIPETTENVKKSIFGRISVILDLDLLKDPIFLHIILGLALVYTTTVTFGMIFPFFLQESVGLNRAETALAMSFLSSTDIVSRLITPIIATCLHLSNRVTFLIGAVGLAFARSFLAEQSTLNYVYFGSLLCGYVRAAVVINQNLTIAEYSHEAKLPAALGLHMVAKGLIVLSVGQFFGWVRDYTESYSLCIHVQSIIIVLVAFSWSVEIFTRKMRHNSNR